MFGCADGLRQASLTAVALGQLDRHTAQKLALKMAELERAHSSIFRLTVPSELAEGRLRYSLALFRLVLEYCFVSHSSNAFPGLDNFDVDVYELKFLFYRLAQRFTVRAQSGDDNAIDLIWWLRWD